MEALGCKRRGEVSERPKERDWKSRTRRKAGRGFKSRPLRLDLSLVRGTRNITLSGHVTSPVPRHAEQAGTPLTYPPALETPAFSQVRAFSVRRSVVDAGDQLAAAHDLDSGAGQPDVEAGAAREEHLVARLDTPRIGARRDHDAGLGS